jgi:hypothetical protein
MRAYLARGFAFAVAGCSLLASASGQYTPYGSGLENYRQSMHQQSMHQPGVNEPSLLTGTGIQEQAPPNVPLPHDSAHDAAVKYWTDSGADCGSCGPCGPACCGDGCGNWFGGVYGLIMTRDEENDVWLSYDTLAVQSRTLTTRDAAMDWSGGFETRLGRYFNCCCNAVEVVYWGLFPNSQEGNVYEDLIDPLATILHVDEIGYDPDGNGTISIDSFYFQAQRHRLIRSYQAHNVEANLLGYGTSMCHPCSNLRLGWSAGVRYFRFDEGLEYATDPDEFEFDGDPEELAYNIDVVNHLIGFQVGGRMDYTIFNCLNTYVDSKVGLYGNHIEHHQHIGGATGYAVVEEPTNPWFGEPILVDTTKDDVAFIAELNVGGSYQATRCLSIAGGYRAVALTGVALSTNQIPGDYLAALDSLRSVDSNGSLILHGAYAGLEFNY